MASERIRITESPAYLRLGGRSPVDFVEAC